MEEPARLSDVLARVSIPTAEIYLAVVKGEAVIPRKVWIRAQDKVKIFPPFGGG